MSEAENDRTDARQQWAIIRTSGLSGTEDDVLTLRSSTVVPAGAIRYSVGAQQEPRILIPLPVSEKLENIPETSALKISDSRYSIGGSVCRFLDITCLSTDLEAVFSDVVDEIITRVAQGDSALPAVRSTLTEFRALLLAGTGDFKPVETIVGLVGELLVLNNLLDSSPHAWKAWFGADQARHDFRAGQRAIEVKSTRSAGNPLIHVQSLEQLEAPTDGTLHLFHLRLEPTEGGLLNVAHLAKLARQKCSDPLRFLDQLKLVDCVNPDDETWNYVSFSLEESSIYEVNDDFPRLTRSLLKSGELKPGISGVKYQVDLNQATQCLLPNDNKNSIQEAFLACIHTD